MHLFNKCHCCLCSDFNRSLLKAEGLRKKRIEDSIIRNNIISSMSTSQYPPPGCLWAQRADHLILSVCVTDVKDEVIKLESTKLYFKCTGGNDSKTYEVEMKFFKRINVEVRLTTSYYFFFYFSLQKSSFVVKPREVTFLLAKLETGPYWDRLLASRGAPWLRIDFNNWEYEEE